MAKGKSRSGTREPTVSLTQRLRSRAPMGNLLRLVEDRRSFDFEPATRPVRLFTGLTARTEVTQPPKTKKGTKSRVPYQIAFSAPAETLVCVRRKRRKEVLHAKRKTGKRGQRRPRRNAYSGTHCK